jgi:hypothetical protein
MSTQMLDSNLFKKEDLVEDIINESQLLHILHSMNFAATDLVMPITISDEILIGSLKDGRLKVNKPIKVRFSKEDGGFVAEAEEFSEFGFGASVPDALNDLQHTIVELYFTLMAEKDRLGHDLQLLREKLQGFVSINAFEKP